MRLRGFLVLRPSANDQRISMCLTAQEGPLSTNLHYFCGGKDATMGVKYRSQADSPSVFKSKIQPIIQYRYLTLVASAV